MENIQVFSNSQFGEIRTIKDGEKILFCGSDVAKALGYVKPQNAISSHCKGALKRGIGVETGKRADGKPAIQNIEMLFIPEGDVYRLIAHSKLPTAEQFECWVYDKVLPCIRRAGGYVNDADMFIETYLPFADDNTKQLFRLQMSVIRQQNELIENQKPLVEFAETVSKSKDNILIRDMAKLLHMQHIDIGEKRLYRLLREHGVLMSNNVPYQTYIDRKYFFVKESTYNTPYGEVHLSKTTLVTPKGQIWLVSKIKEWTNI